MHRWIDSLSKKILLLRLDALEGGQLGRKHRLLRLVVAQIGLQRPKGSLSLLLHVAVIEVYRAPQSARAVASQRPI